MPTSRPEKKPVVVITGISRGLGRALVDEFARTGYLVFGCARSECDPPLCNENVYFTRGVDVSCNEQVRSWADKVLAQAEAPEILINNAGVVNKKYLDPLWEMPEKEFSEVIDTNLKGATNVIRHFSKAMCHARRGIIVNISSRWGEFSGMIPGEENDSAESMWAYCASKAGLQGLSEAIKYDLNSYNVRAAWVNPGLVLTDMLNKRFPERASQARSPQEAAVYVIEKIGEEMKKPIPAPKRAGLRTDVR